MREEAINIQICLTTEPLVSQSKLGHEEPNQQPKPKQYAIYLRSAVNAKTGTLDKITLQRNVNTLYVAERGGVVVGEYADDGASGATLERPGLQRLLEDAKIGRFDGVVVTEVSRLARGPKLREACKQLEEAGVLLKTSQQQQAEDYAGKLLASFEGLSSASSCRDSSGKKRRDKK